MLQTKEDWREKVQICTGLHCGFQSECSQFGHRETGEDIPGFTDTTVPRRLGPKSANRICILFNLSKADDVHQYVVRKPLNKDGKKSRSKHPRFSVSWLHEFRSTNARVLLWRNSVLRKIKKRLQNMLNFWPGEWRKPKKNGRNRLPRDRGCPLSELLLLSLVKNEMF